MDELLNFFSKDPEPHDLLSFSYNPFDDESNTPNALDTILKHGQVLRIRPDPEYYKEFRGTYSLNGMVTFQDKQMNLLDFLKQSRERYTELYDYTGCILQTRKNSNPLRYIEAYVDNKWTFLSKLMNPKSYVEFQTSGFGIYMKDVKNIYYNTIDGGFSYSKLNTLRKKIKLFETKWSSLPNEWVAAYEQRVHDLFTKEEPVSSVPILTVEYIQSIMNDDVESVPVPESVTKPKSKPNAFVAFTEENMETVKKENPGLRCTEYAKIIGDMWLKLSDEEKKIYTEKS